MMDDLDGVVYRGYHMSLVDEACETNKEARRVELVEAVVFHYTLYEELQRSIIANEYHIRRATKDEDAEALSKVIYEFLSLLFFPSLVLTLIFYVLSRGNENLVNKGRCWKRRRTTLCSALKKF